MWRALARSLGGSLLVSGGLLAAGCGSSSTDGAATLLAALNETADSLTAAETATAETAGAAMLAADAAGAFLGPPGPRLTDEQRAALAALHDALAAGTITQEEFCTQLRAIVGDPPCGPPLPPIELTEDQIAQAQTLHQSAHDQIVQLHAAGRDAVLALLTAEQQTAWQALADAQQPPGPPPGPCGLCPPPENPACARPARVPLPPCPRSPDPNEAGDPPMGCAGPGGPGGPPPGGPGFGPGGPGLHGPGGPGGPGMGGPGGPGMGGPGGPGMSGPGGPGMGGHGGPGMGGPRLCLNDEVIAQLGLTAEQVAAITAVHESLRAAVQQLHEQTRAAFRALLTAEQQAEFDALPPPPHGHGHGPLGPPPV